MYSLLLFYVYKIYIIMYSSDKSIIFDFNTIFCVILLNFLLAYYKIILYLNYSYVYIINTYNFYYSYTVYNSDFPRNIVAWHSGIIEFRE